MQQEFPTPGWLPPRALLRRRTLRRPTACTLRVATSAGTASSQTVTAGGSLSGENETDLRRQRQHHRSKAFSRSFRTRSTTTASSSIWRTSSSSARRPSRDFKGRAQTSVVSQTETSCLTPTRQRTSAITTARRSPTRIGTQSGPDADGRQPWHRNDDPHSDKRSRTLVVPIQKQFRIEIEQVDWTLHGAASTT